MIIFNRHYLTKCNLKNCVQTYTNNPIIETPDTLTHIKQWWDLYPEGFSPSQVFVSDMIRTHQTAEMLGYYDSTEDSRIRELPLSEYEGKHISVVNDYWKMTPEFQSMFEAHTDGIISFWNELNKSQDVLIFTHGITIRLFYYLIVGKKIPKYFPDIFKVDVGVLGQMRVNYDAGLNGKPVFININHGNPYNYKGK